MSARASHPPDCRPQDLISETAATVIRMGDDFRNTDRAEPGVADTHRAMVEAGMADKGVIDESSEAALLAPPRIASDHLLLTGSCNLGPLCSDEIECGGNVAFSERADYRFGRHSRP